MAQPTTQAKPPRDDANAADAPRPRPPADAPEDAPVDAGPEGDPDGGSSGLSGLWQIPTILLSVLLIAGGIYIAQLRKPQHDFDGAMDRVRDLIARQELDAAETILRDEIEPHLELTTELQRGRFEALAVDAAYFRAREAGGPAAAQWADLAERYAEAARLGAETDPRRLARWARALLATGDLPGARGRIAALDEWTHHPEHGAFAVAERAALRRELIEAETIAPGVPADAALATLAEYRADPAVRPADEAWAAARQAEVRLAADRTDEAIEHLLIDMRRLETRVASPAALGELYVLLARAYAERGETDYARRQIDRAMELVAPSAPPHGAALVVLGRLAIGEGRLDEAEEAFRQVVSNFVGTKSFAEGLLGRAEARSLLGRHAEALEDYRALRAHLAEAPPHPTVNADALARSLVDRHDAALAVGDLPTALAYVQLAEGVEASESTTERVLFRLASTNRQIGENLLAEEAAARAGVGLPDPDVRRRAAEKYRRAGEYFVRHARLLRPRPQSDDAWALSLWNAADCFDLAGAYDLAIAHFGEYIAGRTEADPRRLNARLRLARCFEAITDFASAADLYAAIIAEHPKSVQASRSHVPLARCLRALGRDAAAEQHLRVVTGGGAGLEPDAIEFRDARLALGTMHYDARRYAEAIVELDMFVRSYPEEDRIEEATYRLADAYREEAARLAAEIDASSLVLADEREAERLRVEHLRQAMRLFDNVRERCEAKDPRRLDDLERSYLRNAYLRKADCAFALGDYPLAIELYDLAARKYGDHPSTLVALIQIVNAYVRLDDPERAKAAHHRVRLRLERMPSSAFDSPEAIMNEAAWRAWLDSLPPGFVAAGAEEGVPE